MSSAPRQITSHLLWFLTFLNLTGWPRFPERLGKHFVTLGWTSGPAIRAVCSPTLLKGLGRDTSCSPLLGGRKGDPPFPRGWGRHQCHCFSPLLVSLQLAHSLPAGPGGSKAHEPHLAQFRCSSGKCATSTKIITAARFVEMQSLEIPNRPVACQGKCQQTLQRQREREVAIPSTGHEKEDRKIIQNTCIIQGHVLSLLAPNSTYVTLSCVAPLTVTPDPCYWWAETALIQFFSSISAFKRILCIITSTVLFTCFLVLWGWVLVFL